MRHYLDTGEFDERVLKISNEEQQKQIDRQREELLQRIRNEKEKENENNL